MSTKRIIASLPGGHAASAGGRGSRGRARGAGALVAEERVRAAAACRARACAIAHRKTTTPYFGPERGSMTVGPREEPVTDIIASGADGAPQPAVATVAQNTPEGGQIC